MPEYQDFFLTINGMPGAYTVEARGPGGIVTEPERFTFDVTDELLYELERIKIGDPPSKERMQAIGSELFTALFPPVILRAFGDAHLSLPKGTRLRLKLALRPPELNTLPWELLFDPTYRHFLAVRLSTPIVRFIEAGVVAETLLAPSPLRVLYLQASPRDLPPLELEKSEAALRQSLGEQAHVTAVRSATPALLQDMLREKFHILHYDGHATYDMNNQQGAICLQDDAGDTHLVSGEMLAAYLEGTSIRLVVMVACESGMESPKKRFTGIAQQLMRTSSLPAAIAMQYAVRDDAAIAFIRGFYGALHDHYPVDAAVIEGRKAILQVLAGDPFSAPDWATPVLFMRAEQGHIFDQSVQEEKKMESESKDDKKAQPNRVESNTISGLSINTGAGSPVNITQASGGSQVTVNQSASVQAGPPPTTEDFKKLLAEIEKMIRQSGVDADTAEIALNDIKTVESQASKEKPNTAIIANKLKGVAEILGAAGGAAAALNQLAPAVQQAIQLAQQIFR